MAPRREPDPGSVMMAERLLRLGNLLGRRVHDSRGEAAGRIEEIRSGMVDGRLVVREYVTGRRGAWQRLSLSGLGFSVARMLGVMGPRGGLTVPARLMDLTDPERPRLRCTREELESRR